jgi:hypothetical protein
VGVIARVPLAFGALSGKFNPKTRFIGDDHRRNLYSGEGLQATLRKVEKLKFLETKTLSLAEAALKWTLAYPEVSTSIPGIRNLRQAAMNCAVGDGEKLPLTAARKAEKLYQANFGLPVKALPSDGGIHAVFMSGIRLAAKAKAKKTVKVKSSPAQKSSRIKKAKKTKTKPKKKKK